MTTKFAIITTAGLALLLGLTDCKPNDTKPTPASTSAPAPQIVPVAPAPIPAHVETPQEMLARFNVVAKQFVENDYPRSPIIITNWHTDSNDGGHSASAGTNLTTDLKRTDSLISPIIAVANFDLNYVKVFNSGNYAPFHATFRYSLNFKPVGTKWEVISGRIRCTDKPIINELDATKEQDVDAADIIRMNLLLKR